MRHLWLIIQRLWCRHTWEEIDRVGRVHTYRCAWCWKTKFRVD